MNLPDRIEQQAITDDGADFIFDEITQDQNEGPITFRLFMSVPSNKEHIVLLGELTVSEHTFVILADRLLLTDFGLTAEFKRD